MIMGVQRGNPYSKALVAGGLAMLTYGWDAGVLGGVLENAEFKSAMGHPNTTIVSMITSVFLLASWLGCIIIAVIGDGFGRKYFLIAGNVVSIIGTAISATSFGYKQLIAGRVVIGIGNGFLTSTGPVYIAEYSIDKNRRGRAVNSMIATAQAGVAAAYWVDFGMRYIKNSVNWRFPIAFQAVFSIANIAILCSIPDTPRFYYAKGREAEGDSVLERLHASALSSPQVQHSKNQILTSLELENAEASKLRIKDFFWDTSDTQTARRIRTGIIIFALAYLQGLDMFLYYTTTIFQTYVGLQPVVASALSAAANTCAVLSICFTTYAIEKAGRKKWLMWGSALLGIFTVAFIGLLIHPGYKTGAAAAAMLFGYLISNSGTWSCISVVYPSEIMPLRYRQIGFSLSTSAQWLMAFLTVFAGPIAAAKIGWKIFLWFLCFQILAIPFVYYCCPETRGKSMEEIDLLFVSDNLKQMDRWKALQSDESTLKKTESDKPDDVKHCEEC
uniref:Major facilitator superfamily (MFS) profile domain-containing protein n=1 Tax=Photinus pyralis TaxID=7054 RepID=A0A1Y1KAA3_PHOPY